RHGCKNRRSPHPDGKVGKPRAEHEGRFLPSLRDRCRSVVTPWKHRGIMSGSGLAGEGESATFSWRHAMRLAWIAVVLCSLPLLGARAEDLGCISTTFNFVSPNDKVCVSDFDDPRVPGVTC